MSFNIVEQNVGLDARSDIDEDVKNKWVLRISVTLNMFCFLFSFNIVVFFVLYFDQWYLLYMHNLKHVQYARIRVFSAPYFLFTDRISNSVLIQEYTGERKPAF